MTNSFVYALPVKLVFGIGAVESLGEITKNSNFSKGVLVTDKLFVDTGVAASIMKSCPTIVDIFSDFTPNPLLSQVQSCANLLKNIGADFVVALGGGSSMDLAKFACSMVFADSSPQEYFYKRKTFSDKHLPLIALPTTAGTGSEVTSVSVCNDDLTGIKAPLNSENFYPYMAVVDPALTLSVPPFVTAVTGLDALSHALEAYWSNNHQPICDMYAEKSLELIFANLEKAYNNGADINARTAMSLGSIYAGLAFAQPKTAAVHGCSYILANYNLYHGEACAFTLDMFLIENASVDSRLNDLAKKLGFCDALAVAERINELKAKFKLKRKFVDIGVKDIEEFASQCIKHPLFANNPKKYDAESLAKELKKHYGE